MTLQDMALIGGKRRVVYTTYVGDKNTGRSETWGYLYVQDLANGRRDRISAAFSPEFGVGRASYGGGAIVASATTDLTERFEFFDLNDSRIKGRPNPTANLPYNEPPFMSDAVLSPNGEWLAYLEGPDTSSQSPDRAVGSWVAVVLSQETGRERLRGQVAGRDLCVSWLDFDGRWIVMSRTMMARDETGIRSCFAPGGKPLPVLVLDTDARPLHLIELPHVVGTATISD